MKLNWEEFAESMKRAIAFWPKYFDRAMVKTWWVEFSGKFDDEDFRNAVDQMVKTAVFPAPKFIYDYKKEDADNGLSSTILD